MNILDLRNDLIKVYKDLAEDKITIRDAKERSNLAGKIIQSAKTQLEYNSYLKRATKIEFLEVNE